MKDHLRILSWLMLLIHLGTWALLQVAPAGNGYVVFKKECFRSEAKARVLAAQEKKADPQQFLKAPVTEHSKEPTPVIKVCLSRLAPPPAALDLAAVWFSPQPTSTFFRPVYYHFLSSNQDPDPPRFASFPATAV